MDLDKIRDDINKIDENLTKLFEKRMNIAFEVAKYKKENNIEILDTKREKQVIENNKKHLENIEFEKYLENFYVNLMDLSKDYQKSLMSDSIVVGFQGVEGSFSNTAAVNFYNKEIKEGSLLFKTYSEFKDVFEAIKNDEISYGVLPLENSSTGTINDIYDLMQEYGFFIVAETAIKATQNLLGIKGAKISDIKKVYSHPQGFAQSKGFLEKNNSWEQVSYYNTATSAKHISTQNDKTLAAIASIDAAQIYNLDVLEHSINDNKNNFTKFILVSKTQENSDEFDGISLVFNVKNEKNSLINILKIISTYNINMIALQSRPVKNKPWQYLFYLDMEGNINEKNVEKCLKEISENTPYYKLLGAYRREVF